MAWIDDLKTARNNYAARLAEASAETKASYDIDGQKVSWTEYQKMLLERISDLDDAITKAETKDEGLYEEEEVWLP